MTLKSYSSISVAINFQICPHQYLLDLEHPLRRVNTNGENSCSSPFKANLGGIPLMLCFNRFITGNRKGCLWHLKALPFHPRQETGWGVEWRGGGGVGGIVRLNVTTLEETTDAIRQICACLMLN